MKHTKFFGARASRPGLSAMCFAVAVFCAPAFAAPAADDAELNQEHVSLQLQRAPLARLLALMERASTVRFRYGTPPDVRVTASLDDAPLLPTLENLLQANGFASRRAGTQLWLLRARAVSAEPSRDAANPLRPARAQTKLITSGAPPESDSASWRVWQDTQAPPPRWMTPLASPADKMRLSRNTIRVLSGDERRNEEIGAAWRDAVIDIELDHQPGLALFGTAQNPASPTSSTNAAAWLRWSFSLREVPAGARLMLETARPAQFFVNGAPLARWSGRRTFDLAEVLQRGGNCLAVHLPATTILTANEAAPLLRYEWFFAADAE